MRRLALLAVGGSLGGTRSLSALLPELGDACPAAIAVVLHRSPRSDSTLVTVLRRAARMPVVEAEDGLPLEPARVVLAPADYHLSIDDGACTLAMDATVLNARPSIDVLFDSAARWVRGPVVAALLSGASEDGSRGLGAVQAAGGHVFVEDPATAESPRMPLTGLARCRPDGIGTPAAIGQRIAALLKEIA